MRALICTVVVSSQSGGPSFRPVAWSYFGARTARCWCSCTCCASLRGGCRRSRGAPRSPRCTSSSCCQWVS
ncbi:hypothetical protein PF005_g15238 [Phytophthora fragariae]|uniref:Uncharacterized protein n=1 Tax=Phytophthora fragariae TaxID=53985 RepID=A0A6A3RLZ5_9STRA|nr:hypothetical protein PF009_g16558 [Phytophthora fragariae]KAE9100068.1 hypothetical protein PF007_g15657 [Phytophthora fragariae]KAE9101221.1 hypothetical protein PF010_g14523 [Phytophthora fragariae]KAE9136683.1 hypothetical protein PF006_g14332 [Phytophthora fragariae]KAE9200714.1 hypothetical protein PF005_g15238 [Phytophthora fragariae]